MYKEIVKNLCTFVLPLVAACFAAAIFARKIYIKIRSNFNANVNCWFCNTNTRVPYMEANSWTCPNCEQYNGFAKDGDYNRDIHQQRVRGSAPSFASKTLPYRSQNGLCDDCNEAQRLKVEKLAQFKPKRERNYDREVSLYKSKLEEQHRLCLTCERHLKQVLREKKKMMLGSKVINFVIKSAGMLKDTPFGHFERVRKRDSMRRLARITRFLTLVNIWCLLYNQPTRKCTDFTEVFGIALGEQLFYMYSHVLASLRVLGASGASLGEWIYLSKAQALCRTLVYMCAYATDLTLPDSASFSLTVVHTNLYPIVTLILAITYCAYEGFNISAFTLLLLLWSGFLSGLCSGLAEMLMLPACIITLCISQQYSRVSLKDAFCDPVTKLHKIYSEDFLGDDETMSMLSEQLNNTNTSSTCSNEPSTLSPRSLLPGLDELSLGSPSGRASVAAPSISTTISRWNCVGNGNSFYRTNNFVRQQQAVLSANTGLSQLNIDTSNKSPLLQCANTLMNTPRAESLKSCYQQVRAQSTSVLMPSRFNANSYTNQSCDVSTWLNCIPSSDSQSSGFESTNSLDRRQRNDQPNLNLNTASAGLAWR